MFELKLRLKSHWILFYNGKEVINGGKIFIRVYLTKYYPDVVLNNIKVTNVPSSFCAKTLYGIGLHNNPHY